MPTPHLPPSPSLGPPDCHLHDASQSPDVRFARVSISGHHFRCLEVWSPAEHPWEGIMGESGRPGLPGPTQDHLEPLNHLWQRPAGPTRAASPRSPILTSMFLLRKKLPADEEEHSMSPAPSSQPLTTLPSPSPSSHPPHHPPSPSESPFLMLTGFQVPVHDALLVQVAQAADQAPKVIAHFRLCQSPPHFQHMSQGL